MAINSQRSGVLLITFALLLAVLPVGTFGVVFYGYLDGLLSAFWRSGEITSSGRSLVGGLLAVLSVNLPTLKRIHLKSLLRTRRKIKALIGSMRQRQALNKRIDSLLEEAFLDENDQQELVDSLKLVQESQEKTWRVVLGVLSFLIAAFFLLDAWQQWREPWDKKHHALWSSHVTSPWLVFFETMNGIALVGCTFELIKPHNHNQRLSPIFFASLVTFVTSTCMVVALIQNTSDGSWLRLELLWLPILPFGFCLLMRIPAASFTSLRNEVAEMESKMYSFKQL